jgi:hypothetical protein
MIGIPTASAPARQRAGIVLHAGTHGGLGKVLQEPSQLPQGTFLKISLRKDRTEIGDVRAMQPM